MKNKSRSKIAVAGCLLLGLVASPLWGLTPTAWAAGEEADQIDVLIDEDDADVAAPKTVTPADKKPSDAAARKAAAAKAEAERLAASLHMRARITAMTPANPLNMHWRYGSEGLAGSRVSGVLGEGLTAGQWTPLVSLNSITRRRPRAFFLTVTAQPPPVSRDDRLAGKTPVPAPRDVEFEFEFSIKGKVLKTVKASGPDGATAGLVIPGLLMLGGEHANDPKILAQLGSVRDYAIKRMQLLEALPWAERAKIDRFTVFTDMGGYGEGTGRGIRHTDPAVVDIELRSLRQLGINSVRPMPEERLEEIKTGKGPFSEFNRAMMTGTVGFPIPPYKAGPTAPPESGCPYAPGVAEFARERVEGATSRLLGMPVQEVWGETIDEIASVFNRTPQRKSHPSVCDYCAVVYREWLQKQGLTPQQFGHQTWATLRPLDIWPRDKKATRPNFSDPQVALNSYYTMQFENYSTAKVFTPLRAAFEEANARKKAALAAGKVESVEAKQPWLYSYAMRTNAFLMGGSSLDYFEFYRHADNAFVYETSNRDPRIWSWDSYLCDVGRVVIADQNQEFGIFVKPHRGAPLQRALSAISRGASMLFWYTYGPDYSKGDSFSGNPETLATTSKASHLIARVEDTVKYAKWAHPAEVAIIKPFSLMAWRWHTGQGSAATAAWEDTKWTYTALAHSHIPVDPIDEVMLIKSDMSRYKVIYLPSPNLRRDAAEKLAAWVQAGGTLVTNADGLTRDEANQPLGTLAPALGLAKRTAPEMWFGITTYGSTALQGYPNERANLAEVPDGAVVTASKAFAPAPLKLAIGREVLQPSQNAEVLARYADGGAASIRHPFGKGHVYVNGFFPGLEYSIPVRDTAFDMGTGFNAATRSFIEAPALLAGVRPVVAASAPVVEGVLLKHPTTGAQSVTLMNWGYRQSPEDGRSHVAQQNVKITIRGAGPVQEVRSAWLDKVLPMQIDGDVVTVTLPTLDEGDVLLLK